jgi:hypothetical protein
VLSLPSLSDPVAPPVDPLSSLVVPPPVADGSGCVVAADPVVLSTPVVDVLPSSPPSGSAPGEHPMASTAHERKRGENTARRYHATKH